MVSFLSPNKDVHSIKNSNDALLLNSEYIYVSPISFLTSSPISVNLLHKRLGHPSKHAMQTILKTKFLPYVNINKHSFESCDACQIGKMHQLHFSPTKIISTAPLELVHNFMGTGF